MSVRLDTRLLDRLIRENPREIDNLARAATVEIHSEIVLSFNTSPPGERYQRGGVTHVASQPGYPPNVDTGTLRASMQWRRLQWGHYRIEDGTEYGIYLEEGTERIRARPFVQPVFVEWQRRKIARLAIDMGLLEP